jgi:hypothetical protein
MVRGKAERQPGVVMQFHRKLPAIIIEGDELSLQHLIGALEVAVANL